MNISDVLKGHKKFIRGEEEGGTPVDRRNRREENGTWWHRREARSTNTREGIFIIPPTPSSVLAKAMKKICQEELKGTNISIGVSEREGGDSSMS